MVLPEAKKIFVHNRDLGFFTQENIPVQRFDESSWCCGAEVNKFGFCSDCKDNAEPRHELIWCNHAGAEEIHSTHEENRQDQPDIVYPISYLQCKCGAYKREHDNYWENAPFEGIYESK